MARARNIKPKFFENEILGGLEPLARLLFIGLWTIADFKGCLECRPVRIKAQLLPYDNCDINALISKLSETKFIEIYTVNDKEYIKIITFMQHQNPHKNERDAGSDLPDFEEKNRKIKDLKVVPKKSEQSPKKSEALVLIPDSLFLIPDTGFLIPESTKTDDFEDFWRIYPKRPGANKTLAFKALVARLKEGCHIIDILEGASRYRDYCKAENVESKYIKHAATFLGPDKHFLCDWSASSKADAFDSWLTGNSKGDDDFIDI